MKRTSIGNLHFFPTFKSLLLLLGLSVLLHLIESSGDLSPSGLHDGGGVFLELLHLLGGVLDAAKLLTGGSVPLVHEGAERGEVELVEGEHEEKELGHDDREGQIEVEESGLLDFGGKRGRSEGQRGGGEEGEGFEGGGN